MFKFDVSLHSFLLIMRRILLLLGMLASAVLYAQIPAGYYDAADNKGGNALRVSLYSIVKNHTSLSYSALWNAFYTTDVRPDNGKVWDIYSDNPDGITAYYFNFGSDQCGNYSGEGDCYNREHSVPKSWFNDATPMYTDLFHLYPTDGWVNNKRGNLPLGEVNNPSWTSTNGSKVGPCVTNGYSGTVFEPNDAYKGDLARTYFYMTVCYMDKNLGYEQSMFTGGSLKPWAQQMLLSWHALDPVSQKEIDRNNAIYGIQANRNPFIDFPELVNMIFGSDTLQPFVTAVDDYALATCSLYPNPTADYVHISITALDEPLTCQLYSLTGQILWSTTFSEAENMTISLEDFPSGIYLLHLQNGAHQTIRKIVKR